MLRKLSLLVLVAILSLGLVIPVFAASVRPDTAFGNKTQVVVYVSSQGLYYDSIIGPDLPFKGRFQKLEMGPNGLQTKFGPGDPGYLGGRWWMDTNNNGMMDASDHYFSCPLLGVGRTSP